MLMIRIVTAVFAVVFAAFPFTVRPHPVSHWDFASYRSGQRVICSAFAHQVATGELAIEAAFDPAAPCAQAGFLFAGNGSVTDCGSDKYGYGVGSIYFPPIPRPDDLPRCRTTAQR